MLLIKMQEPSDQKLRIECLVDSHRPMGVHFTQPWREDDLAISEVLDQRSEPSQEPLGERSCELLSQEEDLPRHLNRRNL